MNKSLRMRRWINKNLLKLILIGGLIIAVIIILKQCKANNIAKKKLAVAEHNINTLNDTIRISQNKAGEDEYNKLAFLTDKVDNLAKLNTQLANAVKNIKGGKVTTIIQGTTQIVTDTIYLNANTVVNDSMVTTNFDFSKEYSKGNSRTLEGFTKYDLATKRSEAQITKDSLNISFTTGIKNADKGKPEIFLTSQFPGFSVSSLEGAVLDPSLFSKKVKQKKVSVGLQLGYSPLNYNFSTKKLGITNQLTFGIGINYRIW